MGHRGFDRYEALIAAIREIAGAEILEHQARPEPTSSLEGITMSAASQKARNLRSHAVLAAMLCNTVGQA